MSLLLALLEVVAGANVTIVSQSRVRMSNKAGFDATDVVWSADQAFTAYQVRIVAADDSLVSNGTLLEQNQTPPAGGASGLQYTITVTDDEMLAAGALEGTNRLKIFVQTGGVWST